MQSNELTNSNKCLVKENLPEFEGTSEQVLVPLTQIGLYSLNQMSLIMRKREKIGVIINNKSLNYISKIITYTNQ